MPKYRVKLYPNESYYTVEIEAENVEEAIKLAEEEAGQNVFFIATDEDVTELGEEE